MEELRVQPPGTTLRLGASILRPAHTWTLLAVMVGLPVLAMGGLFLALESGSEGGAVFGPAIAKMWTDVVQDPAGLAVLIAAAVMTALGIFALSRQRSACLHITSAGLEAYVPRWVGVAFYRVTTGHWSLRWQDVRRVRCVKSVMRYPMQRLSAHQIRFETGDREISLLAFRWFDPAHDHRLGLGEASALREHDDTRALRDAPLVRAIEARGFEIDGLGPQQEEPKAFDLARSKRMLLQVILLFAMGLYAIWDTFIIREYLPLGAVPVWPFALAGVLSILVVKSLGRGTPRRERLTVGALTIAACVAAAYPALLRFNASTGRAETVTYISAGEGRFEPPGPRVPALDLGGQDVPEYWARYPAGTEHEFTLLRGAAGFYQLELTPLYARIRQFYRNRDH